MDSKGGTLNYAGIEIFRQVKKKCFLSYYNSNKTHFQWLLPSKSALVNTSKLVEEHVNEIVPVDLFSMEEGEGIAFTDVPAVFKLLIISYGLEEAAKVGSI
jgi:hypothetical protein